MSESVQLTRQDGRETLTVRQFMKLFDQHTFDQIELSVRQMREAFHAPATVADHAAFRNELLRFHDHVTAWFATPTTPSPANVMLLRPTPDVALNDLRRWYKTDLKEAERQSLFPRGGGFIGVINTMTDSLLTERREAYMQLVFFEYLPVDQEVRIRLAREVIATYGDFLPIDEPSRRCPEILAANIEQVIANIAQSLLNLAKPLVW